MVKEDDELSALRAKAEKGDVEVQYEFGEKYYFGKGVDQDDREAVKWYRKAAEQGHAKAQTKLDEMQVHVEKSIEKMDITRNIEKLRSRLLDMTAKNSLISFRHGNRSNQHIRVISELPDRLYEALQDDRKLTFAALPEEDNAIDDENTPEFFDALERARLMDEEYTQAMDKIENAESEDDDQDKIQKIERQLRNKIRELLELPPLDEIRSLTNEEIARRHGINPKYDLPEPADSDKEISQSPVRSIQTLLKPQEMERKLNGLMSYIRKDIEETGVQTLYAAFGFLQWYESENSDKARYAPLLLLQLQIEKKRNRTGHYTYHIQSTGEDPEINLALSERLYRDFGIRLPECDENETPESYITKVTTLIEKAGIAGKERWRVRRFVTIGRFYFARQVIYHDLDDKKWPENDKISSHEIVKKLIAGSENRSDGGASSDHAEDEDVDTPEVEEIVPLLITSADASQHNVLIDVMKGKNLAVQGPPGTGKSQTITNIIACAIARGKTVLFLAEKMAALNVVHKRLKEVKLDSYCLELHSTKAKKAEVLKSIKERMNLRPSADNGMELDEKLRKFKERRDYISEYIRVMNSKFARQDITVHEYLWAMQWRKDRIGELDEDLDSILSRVRISFASADLTKEELNSHKGELNNLIQFNKQVDGESGERGHPWRFVKNFNLNPFEQGALRQQTREWRDKFEEMLKKLEAFTTSFDLSIKFSYSDFGAFLDNSKPLTQWDIDKLDEQVIADLANKQKAEALVAFIDGIHAYRDVCKNIATVKDIPNSIVLLASIKECTQKARDLNADTLKVSDINTRIGELKKERELWGESLPDLLEIGEHFDTSENGNLTKFRALAEIPGYIASISDEYLQWRTAGEVIQEVHSNRLEKAKDMQLHLHEWEERFNLAVMGEPAELRKHSETITNAGFFAFIMDSFYRRARKLYIRSSKHKIRFDAQSAIDAFIEIAKAKENSQKIERNEQLRHICGIAFDGMETDFAGLHALNEWATKIHQDYITGDKFRQSIGKWLLEANKEKLDSFRALSENSDFIALKDKISEIENSATENISVKKYIAVLESKIDTLINIRDLLKDIAVSADTTFAEIAQELLLLQQAANEKNNVEKYENMGDLSGVNYAGVNTNIRSLEKTADFIKAMFGIDEMTDSFEKFLCQDFSNIWRGFIENRKTLEAQHKELERYVTETEMRSSIDVSVVEDSATDSWEEVSYSALIALFTRSLNNRNGLNNWVKLKTCRAEIESDKDLKGKLLAVYDDEGLGFETLPDALEYIVYRAITKEIYEPHTHCSDVLNNAGGLKLENARAEMKRLDKEIMELGRDALCNSLNKSRPIHGISRGSPRNWTEGALLGREISRQRGHIPIRKLMKQARQSLQRIKPCFLMSPMSVAQYLEQGEFTFDILVIDEASQIFFEEAIGSVARANQIVVIGDPKQLPPTPFFKSVQEDEDTFEAVMDRALSIFRPSRILNRHYRSRHESLIAFSNRHFYDDSLVVFPSPSEDLKACGVSLEKVDAIYTAKSDKPNPDEAKAIVDEAIKFMREHPNLSLGIATMNSTQQKFIEEEMGSASREHPHVAEYMNTPKNPLEPFFIKNLENVQGDERDVIFISTVYGPSEEGGRVVLHGPITHENGHRRLNVLFSRAKERMVVFTSLKPDDIRAHEGSYQGVRALKDFLIYAKDGRLDTGEPTGRSFDSDFEKWVGEKLMHAGYEVTPQVGVAGYRIDLGVKHPSYPYGYLLGVECDGATYHSSKSARERDIIRQQHLENLGWNIYRIWSTDWFSNAENEFSKLQTHIENLLQDKLSQEKPPESEERNHLSE